MKPDNKANKSHKKIVIWGAVILAITILGIAYWRWAAEEQETWDALYESGYVYPSEVGSKLSSMDLRAVIRCSRMGLTQEECPKSTGDTVRRLMATMMTQQAERHGPGPYGKGYAPEYAVAINHMFYQFIQSLEEFPCQPMLYRYASEKTLKVLQEGEFIHRCGQGWRINSEWKERMERTDSIKPVGGTAMEWTTSIKPAGGQVIAGDQGVSCDALLRSQLQVQRGASTSDRMNQVISQVQAQRAECPEDTWDPEVIDHSDLLSNAAFCFGSQAAGTDSEEGGVPGTGGDSGTIGDTQVPRSLRLGNNSTGAVRANSGRDSENNIIVYWSAVAANRPTDSAKCWLYVSRLRSWDHN